MPPPGPPLKMHSVSGNVAEASFSTTTTYGCTPSLREAIGSRRRANHRTWTSAHQRRRPQLTHSCAAQRFNECRTQASGPFNFSSQERLGTFQRAGAKAYWYSSKRQGRLHLFLYVRPPRSPSSWDLPWTPVLNALLLFLPFAWLSHFKHWNENMTFACACHHWDSNSPPIC